MTGLGVFAGSLADERLDSGAALARAADLGFGGCLFGSVFELSPTLDHGEIKDRRDAAAARGVAVAVGSVNLHPFRIGADPRLLGAGDGDALAGFARMAAASALLPGRDLLAIVGRIEDRHDPLTPWPEQLDLTARLLRRIGPVLRDHGLRPALKTHEEIAAAEVERLIDAAGEDVAGVSLDPVNLLVNLDDPAACATRFGTAVTQVMVDDAVVHLSGGVGTRLLCPLGEGMVDWPAVAAALPHGPAYWVELHRGQFTVAPFGRTEPGLGAYATAVRDIVRCTATLTPARLAALRAHQARPVHRLAATTAAARALLDPSLERTDHR